MTKIGFLALLCVVTAPIQAKRNIAVKTVIVTGSMKDSRDQVEYKTVKIGSQWWMAENLNYYSTEYSWCYEDKPSNCDKYGRLYYWDSAMTACPEGWHLPTDADWEALIRTVGGVNVAGKMLKSKSDWNPDGNGVDGYGFNAPGSGERVISSGSYGDKNWSTSYWSSSEGKDGRMRSWCLIAWDEGLRGLDTYKNGGYSVRCIKN